MRVDRSISRALPRRTPTRTGVTGHFQFPCPRFVSVSTVVVPFVSPHDLIRRQYRSRETRSHMVRPAVVAAHRHDAAVAAAEAASHDALDRHLARPIVPHRGSGGRGQHAFGAARIHHHGRRWRPATRARDRAVRRCVLVHRHCHPRSSARAARRACGRSRDRRARRRCARRRTTLSRRRGRAAPRRASANGASPTPPATIQASAGGSTMVKGRPRGPRQAMTCPGRAS